MKAAVLVIITLMLKGGEGVSYGGTCDTKSQCESNKSLDCRKPFPDCTKGYCLCPDSAVEWLANGDGCVLEYRTNGASCSLKDGQMCPDVAGLECKSNRCSCKSDMGTWNEDSKVCRDDGTKVVVLQETPAACVSGKVCVAKSGKVKPCDSATSKCECAAGYKYKDGGCVVDVSNYDGTCQADSDCATSYSAKTEGETAKTITTNFKCKSNECECKDGYPTFAELILSAGFCKKNNGTKAAGAECADSDECSGTMICGKCPEGAAGKMKCYGDNTSGASGLMISVILVAVSCLVSKMKF